MTSRHLRFVAIGLLGVAGAAALMWLFTPTPLDVDVVSVRTGPIAETVADQGVARVRQSYVVSAPVGGRLERLPLEVGDRVAANRTAVAFIRPAAPEFLDPRTRAQAASNEQAARAALTSATAQRDRLTAAVTRARDQLQRTSELARQNVVAPSEMVAAKTDAEQAEQALLAAEADVRTRQANLASAQAALANPHASAAQVVTVTSPGSGVVTRLLQQSERTVAPGAQLVEVGDTAGLEGAIEFLSQDAVKIRVGQRAEIYDWGGPESIPAEVRRVEPQGFTKVSALGVEEQRTLVLLQFSVAPEACAGLAPGYRIWARVYLRELPSALLAPVGALVRDHGEWAVYRLENGRATIRTVHVGTVTDRDAEVLSGLADGDRVVVYPSDQVVDHARVRPRMPPAP